MTNISKVLIACSALALGACSDPLAVDFPGRIPTEQLNDPTLAPVLVTSVLGDFECAYSNYTGGSAAQSDEYETSNSNIPGALWGERTITASDDDYAIGSCENSIFGFPTPLHTARYQSEAVADQLAGWTDAQVPDRASLRAQVRAYGAYSYLLFGETSCSVSFDGGAEVPPSASLAIAETEFAEAITLAQAAGNTDMLNLARVGMARTKMNLKKWADAATFASAVPAGYRRDVTRAGDNARRWNDVNRWATELGAYVISTKYRSLKSDPSDPNSPNDPRVLVADAGRGAFNASIRLWITTKYTSNASPMRLASYNEAQLILAEAQAQQDQLAQAMTTLNTARAAAGLTPLTGTTKEQVIARVLDERQRELSFEGGHRLNDLLRYHIPWKIGANEFTGRPYGLTTCWPIPLKEQQGA